MSVVARRCDQVFIYWVVRDEDSSCRVVHRWGVLAIFCSFHVCAQTIDW